MTEVKLSEKGEREEGGRREEGKGAGRGGREGEKKDDKTSGGVAGVWLFCFHVSIYDEDAQGATKTKFKLLIVLAQSDAVIWHMTHTLTPQMACVLIT